ncbi:MAG: hypothetical protein LBN38_01100 [Verrucomicrobiota bacterium]|jgi:hypothetical protein|nr:hypothetical protein [Verrucomicrobiota bacterium]
MTPFFKRMVWFLNTIGLVIFLVWLSTLNDKQILREQDGIIYFLPCLPFFFVYILLIDPKPKPQNTQNPPGETNHPSKPSAEA